MPRELAIRFYENHNCRRCLQLSESARVLQGAPRDLQVLQRVHPVGARMPLPMPAFAGAAVLLAHRGFLSLAQITMVAADCCLRPGEAIQPSSGDALLAQPSPGPAYAKTAPLLHPSSLSKPSKIGLYDDSVVRDSVDRPYVGEVPCLMKKGAGRDAFLTPRALDESSRRLKECTHVWGIHGLHPYMLRH